MPSKPWFAYTPEEWEHECTRDAINADYRREVSDHLAALSPEVSQLVERAKARGHEAVKAVLAAHAPKVLARICDASAKREIKLRKLDAHAR